MKKFFVANSWGKNEAPLQFISVPNKGTTADTSASKKAKKKKKKIQFQESETNGDVVMGPRVPLAPPPSPPNTPSAPEPPKKFKSILSGRINKKKNVKPVPESTKTEGSSKLSTSFEKKLKENLMGGRFRFINEQLYTMTSKSATRLFQEDPSAFDAYHEGYRHQVEKWPTNPLNKVIKAIKKLPKDLVVGDFGCGEGKLAQSIPNKVYSIDLVSCRDDVIASDMANTPLESECLNIAVYCLSLMGTNLHDCLLEANRVLKMGGLLIIAEIQSRFEDVRAFIKSLENCGFSLTKKDTSIQLFYFFHFKKVKNMGKDAKIKSFSLKPCAYRKR